MSMMKTLAKVAIGVALAKGASSMMKRGAAAPRGQAGQGGLFGGLHSPQAQSRSSGGGGIEDMLGAVLGGRETHAGHAGASGGGMGGLGGLLEQLAGGKGQGANPQGGLNDLLRGLTGRDGGMGLGEDETRGGHLGGAAGDPRGGFGDLLNQAIARQAEPETPPSRDQEAVAALMLRAMIQAMKSDGEIDASEEQKLMGRLGDVSREEHAFVQAELRKPVDVNALAREIPRGLESQVYAMSVMGIDLDSQSEAQYLHELAQALNIGPQAVNDIHAQLGVPQIYS